MRVKRGKPHGTSNTKKMLSDRKDPHHEQALVKVQVSVAEASPMLDRLGGYLALLLLFLTAPGQSRTPQTAVKGHADGVEAPWQLVSGGS